jgi:hypothetical protein
MATTYTLISSVTVGAAGTSEIQFTSIPADYTDLLFVVSARLSQTGGNFDGANLKINGSTSNFSFRLLSGNGSAASSASDSTNRFLNVNIADSTANTFGNLQVYIPNYTSSNNKSISAEAVTETNGTSANIRMSAALWSNSAAITSLSFYNSDFAGSGAIVQYSTAYLYGISNA